MKLRDMTGWILLLAARPVAGYAAPRRHLDRSLARRTCARGEPAAAGAQRGQSLVEFVIVGLTILVPLFLIIPVVAKLISQQQDLEVAARYAAWERTVWYDSGDAGKSDAEVAGEIDRRVFAADTQPVVSEPGEDYTLDPFKRGLRAGAGGELRPLIEADHTPAPGAPTAYSVQSSRETAPGSLVGAVDTTIGVIGSFTDFDLNTDGLFEASVAVDIIDLSDIFEVPGAPAAALRLTRTNALLAEAWTAGGTDHAEELVSGLVPQQVLDAGAMDTVLDIVSVFPFAEELDSDSLIFGHATIEPVPEHRLGPYIEP